MPNNVRKKKILFADDEANIRLLYREVFSSEGYQVLEAADGYEAVKKVQDESPDLVVLDIKMPGLHGLEVLERIRREKPEIPVILCTAYRHMEKDFSVLTSNVSAYFLKPLNIAQVREKVNELIGLQQTPR